MTVDKHVLLLLIGLIGRLGLNLEKKIESQNSFQRGRRLRLSITVGYCYI